jgi:hypothetical protein
MREEREGRDCNLIGRVFINFFPLDNKGVGILERAPGV